MNKGISIKIPDELKNKFKKDKNIYADELKISEEELQRLLDNDKVVQISKQIPIDMNQFNISGIYPETKDIFADFIAWFDFALIELMKTINVDITTPLQKLDVYTSLYYSEEVLTKLNEINDKEILINKIVDLVTEEKDGVNDNPKIKDICTLFINIGSEKIIPHELTDISYSNFIIHKQQTDENIR